jgi:hypothetical protein
MTIAPDTGGKLPRKEWMAGAFVLGLVLGLVLAWRVWPTRWVETDPSDLRAEHQSQYVIMIADSWTVTGDANEARERLYQLVDEEGDWMAVDALIASTVEELEQQGSAAAALRLSRMRGSVPLPSDPVAPAQVEPEAAPETATPAGSPRWALVLIGLAVVVMVIALVIWLVTNEMRKREGALDADQEAAPEAAAASPLLGRALALDPIPGPGGLGIHATERGTQDDPRWDEATFMEEVDEEDDLLIEETDLDLQGDLADDDDEWQVEGPLTTRPALAPEEAWHVEADSPADIEPAAEPAVREMDLPDLDDDDLELAADEYSASDNGAQDADLIEPRSLQSPVAVQEAAPLAVFETTYEFGDDDFYHAFTIESPSHEFLGQCGIVISDVVGVDGAQLVDAFDIWLFETRGTRTISKVLASEHAFTNEDLGAKLARKGELVLAEEGLIISLETETLRLSATVADFAYRDDDLDSDSVFARLNMHMVVEQITD